MDYRHPIKVVAQRTGLSPHLIRMWERRYQAVTPARTETGRRVYSDDDIQKLALLRQATLNGETIGQIAHLPINDLARLVSQVQSVDLASSGNAGVGQADVEYHLNLCLESIRNMDAPNLEQRLLSASVALGQNAFLDEVLQPLLWKTGERWSDGRLQVAHEHLASAVIRSLLGSMFLTSRADQSGPLLLTTTPANQHHEFGALMAAITAVSMGWRAAYLGPNLPAEDVVAAAQQRSADAIALSLVYPPDDPHLPLELRKMARLLPTGTPLLIGGQAAVGYRKVLDEIGAITTTSLNDLRQRLAKLRRMRSEQRAG